MINVGGDTNTLQAGPRNMINICNKYGILLVVTWTQVTHDGRRTTPGV